MILAIDTSLPMMSVALVGPATRASVTLTAKDSRNEKLLPAIDWLLRECSLEKKQLTRIAVTRGPGSFTGVRIGLATVQGLSVALSLPAIGLSTHAAFAGDGSLLVHTAAGRGEYYVSGFAGTEEVIAPSLMSGEEMQQAAGRFERVVDGEAACLTSSVALLLADRVERIGADASGQANDLTPIYVRLAEAEVKLRQKQQ